MAMFDIITNEKNLKAIRLPQSDHRIIKTTLVEEDLYISAV